VLDTPFCRVTDNVSVVPRAQYTLYCINNALFSPNRGVIYDGITRGEFFDKHAHTSHTYDICVSHTSPPRTRRTHTHEHIYNIIPRLMYGGKNSEGIPISRTIVSKNSYPRKPPRHGNNRRIRYRRVYYCIHIHGAAHILCIYIYICDWKKSRAQRKRKKTVSMSFQTSNRQHYKGISMSCGGGGARECGYRVCVCERERWRGGGDERALNLVSGKRRREKRIMVGKNFNECYTLLCYRVLLRRTKR